MADSEPEDPARTPTERQDGDESRQATYLGLGVALGAGLGTVLFALTGQAYWIAIGTGMGVAIGAALTQR